MLTPAQVRKLAEDWKHETLRGCEEHRERGYIARDRGALDQELENHLDFEADAREALAHNDFGRISSSVDAVVREHGLDVAKGSTDYAALSRALLQKLVEVHQIEQQRIVGNYQNGYDDVALVTATTATTAPAALQTPAQTPSILLSEAISQYIAEAKTTERSGEATIYEAVTKCNQFLTVVKDKPINELTRNDVMGFIAVLKRLPTNASKSPQYRGKSIEELLAMNPSKTLSATTVNNYMTRIKSLLSWCHRLGYTDRNLAEGLTYGKKSLKRPDEERKVYAKGDLQRLVDGYVTVATAAPSQLSGRPERVWLPLISLFSGLRAEEVAQLHSGDIFKDSESGRWCFRVDVSEVEGAKRIKSAAARRLVPVHPTLEALGLLEFVESVHSSAAPRYWMNLQLTGRSHYKSFANWFLGNGTTEGFLRSRVTKDPLINFHSLRHTFANALKSRDVALHTAAELMGHSQDDMTFGRYGKTDSIERKLAAVRAVDYGVDFSKLKVAIALTAK